MPTIGNLRRDRAPSLQPSRAAALSAALALAAACAAPISTIRSPAHPRVVEVENTTDEARVLEVEPATGQHLGAATTFSGRLRPGETKVLYLYDGFSYTFRLAASGTRQDVLQEIRVAGDLELAYEGDSLVTSGPFVEVGEPVLVASGTYESAGERQLDRLARQLDVFLLPPERAALRAASLEDKRRLLLEFWSRRDPTPGSPPNEFRDEVEARLAVVEHRFGGGAEPGAATPRGRIWLRHGKPDRAVSRTLLTESGKPYEIWQYFSTGYSYVFLDDLRNGRFVLLTSTDPDEQGRPDWRRDLPPEAAEELLGLDLEVPSRAADLTVPGGREDVLRGGEPPRRLLGPAPARSLPRPSGLTS